MLLVASCFLGVGIVCGEEAAAGALFIAGVPGRGGRVKEGDGRTAERAGEVVASFAAGAPTHGLAVGLGKADSS